MLFDSTLSNHGASRPARSASDAARLSGAADAGAASSRLGLSIVHTSPLVSSPVCSGSISSSVSVSSLLSPARLQYAKGGAVARLKGPRLSVSPPGGKRGQVTLFSRASQRRLRVLLASLNRDRVAYLPLLVTLTYPAEWSPSPGDWKKHLDTLSKRVAREYPDAASVWVLEFQQRGAPHFHLVVFGVPRIDREWLARAWYEVVGSKDPKHLRAGTRVERARKWNALQAYVSKYVSKNESKGLPVPSGVGRWWGVLNRNKLAEMIEWVEMVIPARRFWELRRILRQWLRKRGVRRSRSSALSGVMVFMPAAAVARLL